MVSSTVCGKVALRRLTASGGPAARGSRTNTNSGRDESDLPSSLAESVTWTRTGGTEPLAALTRRLERFADTREIDGQIEPSGPEDTRRLIAAHNAMEARIAALLDEKDVMLGAIGHDLKTPLAALRVRIESVPDAAERERMADTIEDIARTLDDILSLARVGRPTDPLEATDLAALVAAVVEEFEDMDEPVTLAASERIALPVRATWLRRALRNLIANALRYTHEGGVVIGARRQGGRIAFQVSDSGEGIAEADRNRIFDEFVQIGNQERDRRKGLGLGLAISARTAALLGTRIALDSIPGKGSRFAFELPRAVLAFQRAVLRDGERVLGERPQPHFAANAVRGTDAGDADFL